MFHKLNKHMEEEIEWVGLPYNANNHKEKGLE